MIKFIEDVDLRGSKVKRITIDDLVGKIAMKAGVSEDLARAGTLCIGVGIDHALAETGVSGEVPIKTTGAFLLPNLTREGLITMVMGGGPFTRLQAEQVVRSAQRYLVEAIKEDPSVEVENLGLFQVPPGTLDIGPDSPLLFQPFSFHAIP